MFQSRWLRGKKSARAKVVGRLSDDEQNSRRTSNLITPQTVLSPDDVSYGKLSSIGTPQERPRNPLGLTVLFEPADAPPSVDIIFVHGLRGTSMNTWSIDEELRNFWPQKWLPTEPVIQTARISTFGYNSNWLSRGPKNSLSIADYAKELLSELRIGQDRAKEALNIGKVPVIFVVHSMGGLVVKKAYILGFNNDSYAKIIQKVSAILFLATPHRGSGLAELLNHLVKILIPGGSSKHYVAELAKNSSTLEDINEQFRHFAPKLEIFSFYETFKTVFGPREQMILERESSVLGYPGENSEPLLTDHRGVTKFPGPEDPSYIKIRKVLKDLVTRLGRWAIRDRNIQTSETSKLLRSLLAITEDPDEDHELIHDQGMQGSCQWIFSDTKFLSWLDDRSPMSRILWLHGKPGSGKSVLSSYIVEHIREERRLPCQFFYFRYNDEAKRSISSLLRSIAYQIACQIPEFEQQLIALAEAGSTFGETDSLLIWHKLFLRNLFQLRSDRPIFWVIDALDECPSRLQLLSLLKSISLSNRPIRVLFVGWWTPMLSTAFEKLAKVVQLDICELHTRNDDLARFVEAEIRGQHIFGNDSVKQRIQKKLLERANGNFLWARLMLEDLQGRHTEDSMNSVLDSLPHDLGQLYQRMVMTLSANWRDGDTDLAKAILSWTACSRFPLTLQEISQALEPESLAFVDIRASINHVCGDFIQIDARSRVTMVHHTAREYITKSPNHELYIYPPDAHRMLFKKCLSALVNLSSRVDKSESKPFLQYASTSWTYHLNSSGPATDDELLHLLVQFFDGSSVLSWICILSYTRQLQQLVRASNALSSFLLKKKKRDSEKSPLLHSLGATSTLELWATELLKIQGKFGEQLLRFPKAIYDLIPPFCPPESALGRRLASRDGTVTMVVAGFSNRSWDDSLVKFPVERDCRASKISCADQYFAISTSSRNGNIRIFHTIAVSEAHIVSHGEPVEAIHFSNSGHMLATYGRHTTKVWEIATEQVLHTFENPAGVRVLAIGFVADDGVMLTCSNDGIIRKFSLNETSISLGAVESVHNDDGTIIRSPNCAAFNPDSSSLAVAYPGGPLSVWNISTHRLDGIYERKSGEGKDERALRIDVMQICWNPIFNFVLGVYNDGCLVKWHPSNHQEIAQVREADATAVRCSPTGSFLVTSDDSGTLKIWNFEHFSQIYQLSCPYAVKDLAINLDGKRIYDLRGSYCNIWEPNSLIRLTEPDERASEISSNSAESARLSHFTEALVEMPEAIEALAVCRKTSTYCTGHPNGELKIFENDGTITSPATNVAVDHVTWSNDDQYLAVADIGTRVCVKIIDRIDSNLKTIFEETVGSPVQQLLFNKSGNLLLAVTQGSLNIWPVKERPVLARRSLPNIGYQWTNHPFKQDLLVCFGPDSIRVFRWNDLEEQHSFRMSTPESLSARSANPDISAQMSSESLDSVAVTTYVKRLLVSRNGSRVLLHLSHTNSLDTRQEFLVVDTADIESSGLKDERIVIAVALSQELQEFIDRPIGFIGAECTFPSRRRLGFDISIVDDHLVFLSKDGWLCTSSLDSLSEGSTIKRRFFLPQDWMNLESLELAQVTSDGTFLCPKDGEVGLVKNGFRNEWA